jgi:hypothetical protein
MKSDREKLLDDLWESNPDPRRKAILLAGARVLRRRRWTRRGQQCCALLVVLIVAGLGVKQLTQKAATRVAIHAPVVAVREPAHSLTDEELLSLFPDTPVGLATFPDGRKRLLFLRPEDEERWVGRL